MTTFPLPLWTRAIVLGFSSILLALPTNPANAEEVGSDWQVQATPYLWLPAVDAKLNYSIPPGTGGAPEVESDPTDPLDFLNFGFMGIIDIRKGDWSVMLDVMYLDVGDEGAAVRRVTGPGGVVEIPVDTGSELQIQTSEFSAVFGRTLARDAVASVDAFAGVRWMGARVTLDWRFAGPLGIFPQQGSFEKDHDITDAVIGFRGQFRLADDWRAHYYFDVGTGSSDITYQGIFSIGYETNIGELHLAYRHLFSREDGGLIDELQMSGFALGLTMNF